MNWEGTWDTRNFRQSVLRIPRNRSTLGSGSCSRTRGRRVCRFSWWRNQRRILARIPGIFIMSPPVQIIWFSLLTQRGRKRAEKVFSLWPRLILKLRGMKFLRENKRVQKMKKRMWTRTLMFRSNSQKRRVEIWLKKSKIPRNSPRVTQMTM